MTKAVRWRSGTTSIGERAAAVWGWMMTRAARWSETPSIGELAAAAAAGAIPAQEDSYTAGLRVACGEPFCSLAWAAAYTAFCHNPI